MVSRLYLDTSFLFLTEPRYQKPRCALITSGLSLHFDLQCRLRLTKTPAFAFAFQARRFSCDRCHRYKLKCERSSLLMSLGVATPLGPCKRCGKAGVECTSSNAATPAFSRRQKSTNIKKSSKSVEDSNTRYPSRTKTPAIDALNDLASLSPSARPLFNVMESTLTDSTLYLDNFDFDMPSVGEETVDHFTALSAATRGLPLPDRSQSNGPSQELEASEQLQLNRGDDVGEAGLTMLELLNTLSTESLLWTNENSMPPMAEPARRSGPLHPVVETLNNLSELQTFVFKEFWCITEENLTKTFLSQGIGSCHALGSASPDSGLVGKVLYASHRLIDILTSCGRNEPDLPSAAPLRPRSDSLTGCKRTHSDLLKDEELLQPEISTTGSLRFSSPTAETLTTHLDFLRKNTKNPINGRPPPSPKRTSNSMAITPKYSGLLSPAKLTLLVCYVSLLGVYRSILTQAFECFRMLLPPSPSSPSLRSGGLHSTTATHQPHSLSTTTIMGIWIHLEMLAHT